MSEEKLFIIDNKRIRLLQSEYEMYENICRSYDAPNRRGEDYFREHFETNSDGILTFVKPPHNRYSSLEIYCFLISLMVNQHLRIVHAQNAKFLEEATAKYKELANGIQDKVKEFLSKN